ncbi:MAG: HAD family hydrolase [Chloroflexi bacterium]|nr:HAD family hydrolase [Chloroflexota bacterium]
MDGTLVDSNATAAVAATCRELAALRSDLDVGSLVAANRQVFDEYFREIESDWTLGRIDGASVSREAWRRTLERCGCDETELASWAQERLGHHQSKTIRAFSDGETVLEQLAGQVKLALVTNGASDTQRHTLRSAGLEHLFDVVFVSGERGLAKPNPDVFREVLNELEVAPGEALHVGDSLETDILGALSAGLTAVWLNRSGVPRISGQTAGKHEIRSLTELLPLLGF